MIYLKKCHHSGSNETDCAEEMEGKDKDGFIYHSESLMTDNLYLGDQGCHPNREREVGEHIQLIR